MKILINILCVVLLVILILGLLSPMLFLLSLGR